MLLCFVSDSRLLLAALISPLPVLFACLGWKRLRELCEPTGQEILGFLEGLFGEAIEKRPSA